jgi:hypothetical protein
MLAFKTRRAAQQAARCEFTPRLADRHAYVRTQYGWVRVLCTDWKAARAYERAHRRDQSAGLRALRS